MLSISVQFKFLKNWKVYFILSFAPPINLSLGFTFQKLPHIIKHSDPLWKKEGLSDRFRQKQETVKKYFPSEENIFA